MQANFDPNQFLDMQVTDSNSTKLEPVPEGEYIAIIESVKVRQWAKKDDPSVSGLTLDLVWNIDDQDLKARLDRQKVTVRQGVMLDLQENGGLDMGKGKNVTLGRLREAVGLNTPGQPFAFSMLVGRPAKVVVKQRIDGENIYDEVKGTAPVA